ncbi:MAG: hypothetical protein V4598_02020 [Bdellovibrionota bacterium]
MTEVMVGGAILAGVGLAGARLFKDQRQAQTKIDHEQVIQQFHQNLTKFIQDEKNCNATLSNWGWNGRQADQMMSAPFNGNIHGCSNCGATLGFDYDMSNSAAVPQRFIGAGDWIENVNGSTANTRGLWKMTGMAWKPGYTQPVGTGTYMIQVTYRMDPTFPDSRANKTAEVKKDIAISLRFTQAAATNARLLQECLSPKESAVNNLQVDVCKTMTQVSSAGNIMGWQDETQNCKSLGSDVAPVKDCGGPGMVIEGVNADGTVKCRSLQHGVTPSTLIDNSPCGPTGTVRLDYNPVDKTLRTRCY